MNTLSKNLKGLVYDLALPGGRMVGSEGHDRARAFLTAQLDALGCEPYTGDSFELPYQQSGKSFCNIIAVVPGRDRSLKPVLIGAHYDSVIPHPCADDNAAAVAITMEVGRMLTGDPPERDTILAIFDAEEPPYYLTEQMGSIRFYEDLVGHDLQIPVGMLPHNKYIPLSDKYGIFIPHLCNLLFITGAESHPELAPMLEQARRPSRLPTVFTPNRNIGDMSDHAIFRRNGVPYLFLSCGHWQHYHMPSDTPEKLNYHKMAKIAGYVETLVRHVGEGELNPCDELESDTVELEITSLRKTLGPLLPLALKQLGLEKLEDREDLDALAETLLALGL
jgi:hypothetical protein